MKKLNIAIIGLGNIGSYLFKYLKDNKKILTEKNNCTPHVTFVSAKNKKKKRNIKIKKKQWLNNYLDATIHRDVDIIIELIGGAEGAFHRRCNRKNQTYSTRNWSCLITLSPSVYEC